VHPKDLANISFNRIGESKVYGQKETDSMSTMNDQDGNQKKDDDKDQNSFKHLCEIRTFDKESVPNIIAAQDAQAAKLTAAREKNHVDKWHVQSWHYIPLSQKAFIQLMD
jgi:hypothetical protein